MPFLRFPQQRVWRDFVFKADVIYEVGPRLHYKFVTLQGLAENVGDPEGSVERVEDPGEPATGVEATVEAAKEPVVESGPPPIEGKVSIEGRGGPWYDVVDETGRVVNDGPIRKSKAEALALSLNESAESDTRPVSPE